MKKRGQLHHTTWFFLIVLVVIIALGAYYLFPGETAETEQADGQQTETAEQAMPTETQTVEEQLVAAGLPDITDENLMAATSWMEADGHYWLYPMCMAYSTKDGSYCDYVNPEDIADCKNMLIKYNAFHEKDTTMLNTLSDPDQIAAVTAYINKDSSKCSSISAEHVKNVCMFLAGDATDCDIDFGRETYGCDVINEIKAFENDDPSFCNQITHDLTTQVKCKMLVGINNDYCLAKYEEGRNRPPRS